MAALGVGRPALADNAVSEELTYGPAKLNSGYVYVANELSGEVDLVPLRWSLLGNYLLATDAFEALHNTFELGPIWHVTPRLELGAYLLYSPFATGTAHAEEHTTELIVTDRVSSDAFGGAITANYQIGDERRTLTFTAEVASTDFGIDQSVTAPPTLTAAQTFDTDLQQTAITAGVAGRYHWSRLSLQGSYFAYNQNPADLGEISLPGKGSHPFLLGDLSAAAASGLPSAPLSWSGSATFRQQIGQHFAAYLSYAFLEYVSPFGYGQVVTPKVAWQINVMWRVYAAYTFQANSQALFPSGQDEPPQQLQLFTLGVNVSL